LKRALYLESKLDVGRCCHYSGDRKRQREESETGDGKKTQKFKRNATGVDKNRVLETEIGYECHPETDQSTIARERLEERLLNREIHIQVRGVTCAESLRKTRKQIQSGFGTHKRMPRILALPASAERTEFFIDLDVSIHGSRCQSTYSMYGKDDTGHCRPSFLVMRSGRLGGIIEILTDLTLDTPDVPPLPAPTSKSIYCISIFCRTWLGLTVLCQCGAKITMHLGAVFLPVLAFLDGVSRRQGWGHIRRGGKGTNTDSICARIRLTPHLSNIF